MRNNAQPKDVISIRARYLLLFLISTLQPVALDVLINEPSLALESSAINRLIELFQRSGWVTRLPDSGLVLTLRGQKELNRAKLGKLRDIMRMKHLVDSMKLEEGKV